MDGGAPFGVRGGNWRYGWNQNVAGQIKSTQRDQRYDTLIHMQKSGNVEWEIALPNGLYIVHGVAGDASYTNSVYHITAEGQTLLSGTPSGGQAWIEGTISVVVEDGRLTIANGNDGSNNKLNFLDVYRDAGGGVRGEAMAHINFQPAEYTPVHGYWVDSGAVYGNRGNGHSYGWSENNRSTRDRDGASADPLRNHVLFDGGMVWEVELPSGDYAVELTWSGPQGATNRLYGAVVEGTPVGPIAPGSATATHTQQVRVKDGRLTLSHLQGSQHNALALVRIFAAQN